jgi:hypothetical protein
LALLLAWELTGERVLVAEICDMRRELWNAWGEAQRRWAEAGGRA